MLMGIITIPEKLENWSTEILNELIKLSDIESETFDFKSEPTDLQTHICAMANTDGGFLVLGIEEMKSSDGKMITGFRKIGFNKGEEDQLRLKIGNSIVNIEPTPTVNLQNLVEGNKFYTILKIENTISNKPYFVKDRGQCYIRIGNSSRPASRSTILNLFSTSVEQRNNIEKLRVASRAVKESLMHIASDITSTSWDSVTKIHPIDLSVIKETVLSSEWFLIEKNMLGSHTGQTSYTTGINSILHDLELFNTYVEAYNRATSTEERRQLIGHIFPWGVGSGSHVGTTKFLDTVITATSDFLSKFK